MTAVEISRAGPAMVDDYRELVGDGPIRVLEGLARRLRGRRLVMVNSTATGGGVAEILHRLVRLLLELGVDTAWHVMPGDPRFYGITKALHNALHGQPATFADGDAEYFLEVNRRGAEIIDLDGDLILIHDPQPAAFVRRRRPGQHWVWRCHIDLSHADPDAWKMVSPEVERYDAAIFSHAAFVPLLAIPAYLVPPSIDPFSEKNREMDPDERERVLEPFELPARRPMVTQISRFDRIKDPLGVLEAFRLVRRQFESHLVLAGGTADDDPEGAAVLEEVRVRARGVRDVTILSLPPDAHAVINALQRRSSVVVQKSLREGFALTVAEALWKQRAVVASAVGGIPLQVIHEHTGMLVRSVEGCALQVGRLLRSTDLRRRLGAEGRAHVRENFLHTREARDYLAIFARLLEGAP